MSKTIIEQLQEDGMDLEIQSYVSKALRLFAEKIERKSFLKSNEELRIINEHIYQQLKKSEGIK